MTEDKSSEEPNKIPEPSVQQAKAVTQTNFNSNKLHESTVL